MRFCGLATSAGARRAPPPLAGRQKAPQRAPEDEDQERQGREPRSAHRRNKRTRSRLARWLFEQDLVEDTARDQVGTGPPDCRRPRSGDSSTTRCTNSSLAEARDEGTLQAGFSPKPGGFGRIDDRALAGRDHRSGCSDLARLLEISPPTARSMPPMSAPGETGHFDDRRPPGRRANSRSRTPAIRHEVSTSRRGLGQCGTRGSRRAVVAVGKKAAGSDQTTMPLRSTNGHADIERKCCAVSRR